MKLLTDVLERTFKFLASLQLAAIVLSSLAIISAIGTIVEARYDAQYAQKMVYHSPYMYFTLALLCVNLINVMIDRWPWRRHHSGFVLAHTGIVLLILGALVTKLWGVDGSISFDIGQTNRYVMVNDTELDIFSSLGTDDFKLMYKAPVDFLLHPPEKNPYVVNLGSKPLKITKYYHYALRQEDIVPSTEATGSPAIRIQLQNANVNVMEWILRDFRRNEDALELGPARVVLTEGTPKYRQENEIYLVPQGTSGELKYYIFTKRKGGLTKQGRIAAGDQVDVGWMGLQLRVLKYIPKAKREVTYIRRDRPNDLTNPALAFEFDGHEYWLGMNASLRLFTDISMYVVSYGNRRLDLGFDIHLDKFSVGRYQGTMRASSYASDVTIPDVGSFHISMNHPLKHGGFTFYQASFQEDGQGKPTTSILSVNRDPGRWIKYLGSLCIVLGTILMFYFKQRIFVSSKKKPQT